MMPCALATAVWITACSSAYDQPAATAARAIVTDVANHVEADYVVDETRVKLVQMLRANLITGRYDRLTGDALARQLNSDMAAIAHDRHLGLRFAPDEAKLIGDGSQHDDGDANPAFQRFMANHGYGVRELRLLDGNVRYMAYDGFMYDGVASDAAIEVAMRFLAGGDAVIIDLRQNGGGDPRAVATLASYFLPPNTALARFEMRGKPAEANVTHSVPLSLSGKPLFVLTGDRTASAAEEFATHVAAFGFGTLVGENTAGAAYRNDLYALPGGYILSISIGRPVHAVTGGNWEAKGVAPKLASDPGTTMEKAESAAYAELLRSATPEDRSMIQRLSVFYAARSTPVALARAAIVYAGRYGERTVRATAGHLTIQRDGGAEGELIPLGCDRFALALDPTTQVSFVVAGQHATAMELSRASGEVMRAERIDSYGK